MTDHMTIVFAVLAGAIALFAWGRPRADIVALLVVLALMLSGVLTPQESLAGFGDPVVILIAAIFIVGEGLVNTGVAHRLGDAVLRMGAGSESRLIVLVMILAGGLGAFMSSSAIVAMLIPVVLAITANTGLNRKRMLMPLAVASLTSGMMTLIASSPNMIVDNTLRARHLEPIGFFGWTPFGLAVLVLGVGFMLATRGLLSKRLKDEQTEAKRSSVRDLVGSYGLGERTHRLRILPGSPLLDRSVARAQLQRRYGVLIVGFQKHRHGKSVYLPALPETVFQLDDAIMVIGDRERVDALIASEGLMWLPLLGEREQHEALQEIGAAEIMLTPESKVIGKTLRELEFRARYSVAVLAIRHRGEPVAKDLADQPLDFGDTLLVWGDWTDIRRLGEDRENFVVLTLPAEFQDRMPARKRAPIAVAILLAMIAAMAFEVIPNTATALIAALAMVAGGCVKLDSIYRVISWKTDRADRRHAAARHRAHQDRRHRGDGQRVGRRTGVAGTDRDACGRVSGHRRGGAIHFELRHRRIDRPDRHRGRPVPACLAPGICHDRVDCLLRGLRHPCLLSGQYAGHGAGGLRLRGFCQDRSAAAAVDHGRDHRIGRGDLSLLGRHCRRPLAHPRYPHVIQRNAADPGRRPGSGTI